MRDERLTFLLDTYLDGALTPEEKAELERMLLESDAARRQFWERSSLHGWTYEATKLAYSASPARAAAERRELRNSFSIPDLLAWLLNWKRLVSLATACVIVAAAVVLLNDEVAEEDDDLLAEESSVEVAPARNNVAMLTHGANLVWAPGTNSDLEIGGVIEPGVLKLKSGVAQIQMFSGVRVILEGPAEYELLSTTETRLDHGKLSAHVPENARGFKVHLENMTVTDLGTEFGVHQPPAMPPEVHVFEGEIELALAGATQPAQKLTTGQTVEVQANEVRPLPAARTVYISENELARRETTELQSRYAAWRQMSRNLDGDRAMLVHYDFENARSADKHLANRAKNVRKGTIGSIVGADWTEGRWPGKNALEFKDAGDRVKLAVPGRHRSLTYMAWLRVDNLPVNQNYSSIALTHRHKPGEVHWQITRSGKLYFSIRLPPKDKKSNWERLQSKTVFSKDKLARWMHVAAVYDGQGKTMSIYADGKLVGSKKLTKTIELEPVAVELGNWSRKVKSTNDVRNLKGRMDEFSILSRPLSADEIRRQYELGKPRETIFVASAPASSPAAH